MPHSTRPDRREHLTAQPEPSDSACMTGGVNRRLKFDVTPHRPPVQIDADVAHHRQLALHDRAAPKGYVARRLSAGRIFTVARIAARNRLAAVRRRRGRLPIGLHRLAWRWIIRAILPAGARTRETTSWPAMTLLPATRRFVILYAVTGAAWSANRRVRTQADPSALTPIGAGGDRHANSRRLVPS